MGATNGTTVARPDARPWSLPFIPLRTVKIPMRFSILCAVGASLLLAVASGDPREDEDKPLAFGNMFEKAQLQRCEFNRFRGESCAALMERLCSEADYKNNKCRSYNVRRCHARHGPDPIEEKCEKGVMFDHCYGNNGQCAAEERESCRVSRYGERFCGRYQWLDCTEEGFRSSECKSFHNKVMISHQEEKLGDRLLWERRGQNATRRAIPQLQEAKLQLEKAIKSMEDDTAIAQAKGVLEKLEASLSEARHVEEICHVHGPFQRRESEQGGPQ